MAAKKRMREEAYEKKAEVAQIVQEPAPVIRKPIEQTTNDYLDRFRHTTRRAAAVAASNTNRYIEDDVSQEKSSTESDSMVGRLRKRSRRPPRYTEIEYPQRVREDKAARLRQQEKLEELSNRRRSTRLVNQGKKRYDNLNEEVIFSVY